METLTIRVYTKEQNYKSSREIKILLSELHDFIESNYLKSEEKLEDFYLEGISHV